MIAEEPEVFDRWEVCLDVEIRVTREEDLPALEWHGVFGHHRWQIEETFEEQQAGDALMLVAHVRDAPVGQVWVDLRRKRAEHVAHLWALRVMPHLEGNGIARRLIFAAEAAARERGFLFLELAVDVENARARKLYGHLGFLPAGREPTGEEEMPYRDLLRRTIGGVAGTER